MKLPKLEKARLTDQVADILYNKIAEGELKPGDKLPSEIDLSDQLGVGRPTVREALSKLIGLGLIKREDYQVTVAENAYASVRSGLVPLLLDDWEIRELYEARILIECDLVSLAIRKATPDDIMELREINEKMQNCLMQEQEYWNNDMEFHACIASISGNAVMQSISAILKDMFQRYESKVLELHTIMLETYNSHQMIIDAIERKDEQAAREITIKALSNSEKALYELKKRES